MLEKVDAPATTMGDGEQTNDTNYTLPAAVDVDPAHPANLLPSITDYLTLSTFGAAFPALSRTSVCVAQGVAIDVLLGQLGVEHRAWLAPAGTAEATMLEAAYRLTPGAQIRVGVGACRPIEFPEVDRKLVLPTPPPPTGSEAFDALTLRIRLGEFRDHARRYGYTTTQVLAMADVIAPHLPLVSWQAVGRERGVV